MLRDANKNEIYNGKKSKFRKRPAAVVTRLVGERDSYTALCVRERDRYRD